MSGPLKRVLFVCIGNSCRSQMAEGFARAYGSDVMAVASAGLSPATRIAPDIAVTNAHNANLIDPRLVVARDQDFDLLFFRSPGAPAPQTADPSPGLDVIAYGQGADGELRVAHGVVRQIASCNGCGPEAAWFTFAGDAGPGFSGGPVLDEKGRLVGITFGYRNQGGTRLIYAYDMARVAAEAARLHALESGLKTP